MLIKDKMLNIKIRKCCNIYDVLNCFEKYYIHCVHCFEDHFTNRIPIKNSIVKINIWIKGGKSKDKK